MAKYKLNIIETLMSQVLIDFHISHEGFEKIIDKKIKYEETKEHIRNIRNIKSINDTNDTENTALNKENNQVTNL